MTDEKRPLKVFLCHASADKPQVRELYRRLVHDGIDAWLDEAKLLPGMEWQLEIPKAVRDADAIVICLSNNSVTKEGYVQKEIRFALDVADEKPEGTIYLIPVRLDDCVVPSRLARWQWVDLFTTDGYRKLRRSLRLRADGIGAGFSPMNRRPETGGRGVQADSNATESPDGYERTVNFGLIGRLLAVLFIVILACVGIFQAGKWMTGELAAWTYSPTPTSTTSFTPEPLLAIPPFSPTPVPPSETPTETATPFVPLPTDTPAPTQTLLPTYTAAPPTPTPTAPMVLIPAGSFVMGNDAGDPDEKPAHTVYLDEYYIDKFEVTNGRYSFCVGSGVCKRPSNTNNKPVENYYSENYSSYPVVNISWEMAKTYCEWRGARLPTEAEWEKAARGGLEGQLYPWGNENPVCDAGARNGAQFKNCQDDLPIRVGLFAANDYQLYDMAGNVWEWVGDWYQADYYSQVASNISNPQGPSSGERRVVRGGSWADANITVANRGSAPPETQDHAIGFRCVRDVLP